MKLIMFCIFFGVKPFAAVGSPKETAYLVSKTMFEAAECIIFKSYMQKTCSNSIENNQIKQRNSDHMHNFQKLHAKDWTYKF